MTIRKKILDLIINTFPYDNGEDYDITFEIANNAFSPFQQVDYLINGIFKDVNLMNKINSNDLKDEDQIKNKKNQIYTNGKIIYPIYKIKKSNNEESNETGSRDDDDDDSDYYDDNSDVDTNAMDLDDSDDNDDDSDVDDESVDVTEQQNRKRQRYSRRGGKNKKQNRKTKKHSKK